MSFASQSRDSGAVRRCATTPKKLSVRLRSRPGLPDSASGSATDWDDPQACGTTAKETRWAAQQTSQPGIAVPAASHDRSEGLQRRPGALRQIGAVRATTSMRTCRSTNAGLDQPRPTVALIARGAHLDALDGPASCSATPAALLCRDCESRRCACSRPDRDDLQAHLTLALVGEQPPSSTPTSLPARTNLSSVGSIRSRTAARVPRFVQPGRDSGLGRAPAPSMRATALDRLLTGASQTIGKRLVAVPSAPGVVSAFMAWQSATLNRWAAAARAPSRGASRDLRISGRNPTAARALLFA